MSTPFHEVQRFRQWWLWVILVFVALLPVFGLYKQLVTDEAFGSQPLSDAGLLIYAFLSWVFVIGFYFIRLELTMDQMGVSMKIFPFYKRKVSWEDVDRLELVNYGFVGGYGVRITSKYGTVYNMSGREGLLITLKNGNKFCVGTQRKEELNQFLKALGKY